MPGVCFKNIPATAKQILCVVELSGREETESGDSPKGFIVISPPLRYGWTFCIKCFFELITLIGFSWILDANSKRNEKAIKKKKILSKSLNSGSFLHDVIFIQAKTNATIPKLEYKAMSCVCTWKCNVSGGT